MTIMVGEKKFDEECARYREFQILTGTAAIFVIIIAWFFGYRLFAALAAYWLVYRLYKIVGRRCRKCGRVLGVKRKNEIHLAPDESVSLFSPRGQLRWWIRRVYTETFSICMCGWAELVKHAKGPLSVWHAFWIWYTDRKQFFRDPNLSFVSALASRNAGTIKDLEKFPELDTPPIVAWDPPQVPETPELQKK